MPQAEWAEAAGRWLVEGCRGGRGDGGQEAGARKTGGGPPREVGGTARTWAAFTIPCCLPRRGRLAPFPFLSPTGPPQETTASAPARQSRELNVRGSCSHLEVENGLESRSWITRPRVVVLMVMLWHPLGLALDFQVLNHRRVAWGPRDGGAFT